jgi:hypothetical protein
MPSNQTVYFKGKMDIKEACRQASTREPGTSFTKRVLGHEDVKNTEIYINIVGFDDNENYVCKVGATKEEWINLIEPRFERLGEDGDEWYFRKRK